MKKKQVVYSIIFLICLTLVMIFIITPSSCIFGSNTDWFSQHVNLADYLRQTMLENKTLFPNFAFNIGAGENIYNISYYGLFRPDILIGCLIPGIAMKDIIITYMIINLSLSVILIYLWLKRKHFSNTLSLIGAVLLLSSSVLFHSHRQIMFVDYLPGLLLALIGIDRMLQGKKNILVTIGLVLVIVNSYFFSIAGIIMLFSYYCYAVKKINLKVLYEFIKPVATSILICGVLLLPTAYVMLENHQSGGKTIDVLTLLIPRINLTGLLYDGYGCGMAYLSWIGIVLSLKFREVRKLSVEILLLLFVPIFCFGLNGFLYARTKILIPFIPLIIYVVIYTLEKLKANNVRLEIKMLILILIPLAGFYDQPLIILDALLSLIIVIIYLHKTTKVLPLLMIMPLVLSYVTNLQEDFVSLDTYRQVSSKSGIKVDNDSRFDIFDRALDTSNLVNHNALRTSLYSSVNNSLYNRFYYDLINNPISIRNRVAMLSNSNIFFQGFMGVKTIYSTKAVPIGYQKIDDNLYQNNNVLPIIYATNDTYDLQAFDKLQFPMTLDTLYNNVIVENGKTNYQSKIQTTDLKYSVNKQSENLTIDPIKNGYRVNTKGKGTLELSLNQDLTNQILIIEFDLNKVKYLKTRDTSITINQIKNKLSSSSAPYPNGNTHFTYIISQNDALNNLSIEFTSGRYDLQNIKIHTLNYDVIKNRNQQINKFEGTYNQDGKVAKGVIDVKEDGYLVTSLPYQNGYQLKIDGQIVKGECVNKAFLGAQITSGKHEIEITFKPPFKDIGLMCSLTGVVLFVIQGRKRNEKGIKGNN
ncbi:MAG: YfhO family protein [Thomasclavelia sp.]